RYTDCRRRPDARVRRHLVRQAARSRRGARAARRAARQATRAGERRHRGEERRGNLALGGSSSPHHARFQRSFPRWLSGGAPRRRAGVGRRLSARGTGRATVRAHRGRLFLDPRPALAAAARLPARPWRGADMIRAGVMGWPVEHSRSPLLHGFWLKQHGIDGAYELLPVPPESLETALRGLAAQGFAGCNLTVPHKQAALAVVDHVDATAARIGAVNTVVVRRD